MSEFEFAINSAKQIAKELQEEDLFVLDLVVGNQKEVEQQEEDGIVKLNYEKKI